MENKGTLLGILGGLGPMSGVYFCETLISHTRASCDKEHINFLLSSRADTPDRSSFIIGASQTDPSPVMAEEARRLQSAGAQLLAIPCNTAHYFYEKIRDAVDIPVINIIEESARYCSYLGVSRVGVLATEGTSASGAYRDPFAARGICVEPLTKEEQDGVSLIIFDQIKSGLEPDMELFEGVCDGLRARGCQALILGCTELSLIKKRYALPEDVVDSLELLTLAAIVGCGKTPVGFDSGIMRFYEDTKDTKDTKGKEG